MITSWENDKLKFVRKLSESKSFRDQESAYILEHKKAILERSDEAIFVLCREGIEPPSGLNCITVEERLFDRLSGVESPQGMIAVISRPQIPEFGTYSGKRLLILDGIQDPGNMGAVFRSAAAFGWAVARLSNTADPFSPKALRASAGTVCLVPQFLVDIPALEKLDHRVYRLSPHSGCDIKEVSEEKVAVILGSEGKGSHPSLNTLSSALKIPMTASVESLNVAVTAGIICYVLK